MSKLPVCSMNAGYQAVSTRFKARHAHRSVWSSSGLIFSYFNNYVKLNSQLVLYCNIRQTPFQTP